MASESLNGELPNSRIFDTESRNEESVTMRIVVSKNRFSMTNTSTCSKSKLERLSIYKRDLLPNRFIFI
jgi:hypothetical protein